MREKKSFAQCTKTRGSNEVKKKYFLVYEGDEAEELYFEAVGAILRKFLIGCFSILKKAKQE